MSPLHRVVFIQTKLLSIYMHSGYKASLGSKTYQISNVVFFFMSSVCYHNGTYKTFSQVYFHHTFSLMFHTMYQCYNFTPSNTWSTFCHITFENFLGEWVGVMSTTLFLLSLEVALIISKFTKIFANSLSQPLLQPKFYESNIDGLACGK